MGGKSKDDLASKVSAALAETYPGVTVEVGRIERWDRPCITVRWAGFADLLPEERFQRVVKALPDKLRKAALSGYIWLELAPGESIDAFLKHPRSEDIAGKEREIHNHLKKLGFYEALASTMGGSPKTSCGGDFGQSIATLRDRKATAAKQRDARLLFIRHGAFCDCQVLETILPELEKPIGR